jgi:predicted transcriptional regulator of viral defense system
MTSKDRLKKIFQKKKILSSKELESVLGNRPTIFAAVQANLIVRVGSGFYSAPNVDANTALLITVGRFFPKAIISGISALAFHSLSDEQPNKVNVDIERTTSLRNQILQVRRVSPAFLTGIETVKLKGVKIKVYDVERSLCDIYRIEKDGPIFIKAIKRYAKEYKINPVKIAKYDSILKTRVLSHLKQELADG